MFPRLGSRVVPPHRYGFIRQAVRRHQLPRPPRPRSRAQPYSSGGTHAPSNGILLRRDLHTLFDRGYITVTPSHEIEVSSRIKEEFHNGKEYYALHGQNMRLPEYGDRRPSADFLKWHNDNVYLS